MTSPNNKDQAQGSVHTEQAPGSDPTEQVQDTHQTGQGVGSSDPTEQVQDTPRWGKAWGRPTPWRKKKGTNQLRRTLGALATTSSGSKRGRLENNMSVNYAMTLIMMQKPRR